MDAIAAVTHADPYPYYAELAARGGLFFDARLKLWIAAGADEVRAVLGHTELRVRPVAQPVPAAIAGGSAGQVFGALVRMNDGERHVAPRMVLQRALAALHPGLVHARASAVAKAGRGMAPGSAGALNGWMFAVPVQTVASLLGFPDHQLPQVATWMSHFVACLSPLSSAEQIAQSHRAALALLDRFTALLQAACPQSGSLLAAVLAEADAVGWNNSHAILANLVGLLSQTYEATAGLIGNSIVALIREPAKAGMTAAELVASVMRNDPPIQNTRRFAAQATDVAGSCIEAGQAILVLLAATGRSAAAAAAQEGPPGYGHGIHACPGQALSQTIAAAALETLLLQGPPASFAWRYRPSVNARIPEFIQEQEAA